MQLITATIVLTYLLTLFIKYVFIYMIRGYFTITAESGIFGISAINFIYLIPVSYSCIFDLFFYVWLPEIELEIRNNGKIPGNAVDYYVLNLCKYVHMIFLAWIPLLIGNVCRENMIFSLFLTITLFLTSTLSIILITNRNLRGDYASYITAKLTKKIHDS